jgi:hypothetical protein
MTFIVPWIVAPVVLAALSLGCGLLVQRAAGPRVPGVLLLPIGYALIVVAASFSTLYGGTARLTTPLVVSLAVAGFGFSASRRTTIDLWAAGAAVTIFAAWAAPIVLSGSPTFAGYLTLDDTATWLALADNALQHGRSLTGLAPSTYEAVLHDDLHGGYPLGTFLPLGIAHELTGQDEAWLFQPLLAYLGALLGLSLYSLASGLITRPPLRATAAVLGAVPALLYAYVFWSGIKETSAAALIALISALAVAAAKPGWGAREMAPLGVAAAATLDCLSVAGAVWFLPLTLFAVVLVRRSGLGRAARALGALTLGCLALAIPALSSAGVFVHGVATGEVTNGVTLGNLLHPLSFLQIFGIWPVGDFRVSPKDMPVVAVLIGALGLAALIAVVVAWRRRAWEVPVYLVGTVGCALLVIVADKLGHGSPWLDAKALTTASPGLVLAGAVGCAVLFEAGRRVEATVLVAAIAGGVVWSDALAYGSVWLAPRAQLAELQTIGARFSGDGPALMTEYQPYGVRHFLRTLDAEGAAERRVRPVYLRSGGTLDKLQYADLDAFQLASILIYRTLVLRTSPYESRPPSVYQLAWHGNWYEVWQRPIRPPQILAHVPLGKEAQPSGVPPCSELKRLAELAARDRGRLVAATRSPAETYDVSQGMHPSSWQAAGGGTLVPRGSGTATVRVTVTRSSVYGLWLGGSFRDPIEIAVDGRRVGAVQGHLSEQGLAAPLARVRLSAGPHEVGLRYSGPGLRPGSRGYQFAFGPLVVGSPASTARLVQLSPSDPASSPCGRSFDWLEIVR